MIKFKTLRIKNFLSFGESFSEIDFTSNRSTLITGRIGSGKSSVSESLSFVLFGKSYRKANKSSLVNYKNNKDCLIELEFDIDNISYKIRRGIKPNIFEIYKDDILINQDSAIKDYQKYLEDNILHLNYSTFCNTILIGKASYTSFFKYSASERRKFIEDILSLNIISVMNDINKSNISKIKTDISDNKLEVAMIKTKLDSSMLYIKKIKKEFESNKTDKINELNEKLKSLSEAKSKCNQDIEDINENISNIYFDIDILNEYNSTKNIITQTIYKIDLKIEQLKSDIEKLTNNRSCNSCGQVITQEYRELKISEYDKMIESLICSKETNQTKLIELNDLIDSLTNNLKELNNLDIIKNNIQIKIYNFNDNIKDIEDELNKINLSSNSSIETEKELAKELLSEYQRQLEIKNSLLIELEHLETISEILKDTGIKSSIIRQYLPIINSIANEYLNKFGFHVKIEFDEFMNEKIFTNGFIEQSYVNYSAGEMLRIDLAMLLTFRYISKIQKNSDSNLLFLDEILDASLDQYAMDAFMEILNEQKDINVFIITHNIEKYSSSFDSELVFSKENGFTKIIKL